MDQEFPVNYLNYGKKKQSEHFGTLSRAYSEKNCSFSVGTKAVGMFLSLETKLGGLFGKKVRHWASVGQIWHANVFSIPLPPDSDKIEGFEYSVLLKY